MPNDSSQIPKTTTSSPLVEPPTDHSDGDGELQIVLPDTPKKSPRKSPIKIDPKVVETIEDEIGAELKKKAEKTNLTVHNVKSIIRQVLTHENVRAMLGNGASDDESVELPLPFEPKITRSKAKELLSANSPPANIPWVPVPPPSETIVLIGEDLKEDDSGDEYVPGEEDSEDENNESCASESDVSSLPPPTPPTICTEDQSTQTTELTYTEDGVFKIPPPKTLQEEVAEEVANIALRTRSKINLSSTPLEVIEEGFIPPDITTDMYDMECDDDDWKEFLKGFTKPLEELSKPTEDDEHDPEYDYLADDDKNLLDKEDLRIDKAVKITKKEVKELWEEVFDYLHNLSCEYGDKEPTQEESALQEMLNSSLANIGSDVNNCTAIDSNITVQEVIEDKQVENSKPEETKSMFDLKLTYQNLCIIEQQMRQHVQMLTQNFILTYEHPEYHDMSDKFKEYLLNLKFLGESKAYSVFRPLNLLPALEVVDFWVNLFQTDSVEVLNAKKHVQQELSKSLHYKMAGNYQYTLTFPKLVLETVLKSEVFTYGSLLPQIPFKSEQFFGSKCAFTDGEDRLLAFGLDQFKTFLGASEKNKKIHLNETIALVQEHMMPHRTRGGILKHIMKTRHPRCLTNPIQQYFMHNKVKRVVHYIYPLDQLVAPCKRLPDELPAQWRDFANTQWGSVFASNQNVLSLQTVIPQQYIIIQSPLAGSALTPVLTTASPFILQPQPDPTPKKPAKKSKKLKNTFNTSTPSQPTKTSSKQPENLNTSLTAIDQFVSIFLRPIPVQNLVRFLLSIDNKPPSLPTRVFATMSMLNMPSLNTPVKTTDDPPEDGSKKPETVTSSSTVVNQDKKEKVSKNLEFLTITNSSFQKENTSREVEFSTELNSIQISQILESEEDGVGSSSGYSSGAAKNPTQQIPPCPKPNPKKEPTIPKKKGIKIKKDFLANLAIASPEDPESEKRKNELFAIAYYDKLRETLDLDDYHKIMQILNDFGSGDVIDLYKQVQSTLRPKYEELAEEFLLFLREKEAAAVGQLIPWLDVQARARFLRKLEIFLKDQPGQLKKIYNVLMELTKEPEITKEKVKSMLVPMLKGNTLLYDLLVQNFKDERPPESLLQGPYETIDVNKELARPEGEEIFENFVVPNDEDKYGGQNCVCHCHRIEDKEYKSRVKHCTTCGLKFVNGKLYLAAGRSFQPATVTFRTSPHINHNSRLMPKTATSGNIHKKKRSDTSPHKISGKEHLEEDTEDEEPRKRKRSLSQKSPKKRRKTCGDVTKACSPPKRSPRKRTYSGKGRAKKEEINKTEMEEVVSEELAKEEEKAVEEEFEIVAELEESEHETSEEQAEKLLDDCMDSSGESLEKPLSPGQQTAESESEIYQEESSQDNYESDESTSSEESTKGSQSDTEEPPWRREEDTIILETLQKEDDKEYALQIIADQLPSRTVAQIRNRLTRLMDLLIETLRTT